MDKRKVQAGKEYVCVNLCGRDPEGERSASAYA